MIAWADAAPEIAGSWDAQTQTLTIEGIQITDPELIAEVADPAGARKQERQAR